MQLTGNYATQPDTIWRNGEAAKNRVYKLVPIMSGRFSAKHNQAQWLYEVFVILEPVLSIGYSPKGIYEKIFDVVDDYFDQPEFLCRNGGSTAFRGRWQFRQATLDDAATGSKGSCSSAHSDTRRSSCCGASTGWQ